MQQFPMCHIADYYFERFLKPLSYKDARISDIYLQYYNFELAKIDNDPYYKWLQIPLAFPLTERK